jgi:AraC family transcriptional regulator
LGKLATTVLGSGRGWTVTDIVCGAGPEDRPFEEQHGAMAIAVVLDGCFQYRSARGSHLMSPGSVLLGNYGQCFECGHEHGTGDRCVAFHYSPDYFEEAGAPAAFSTHQIPALASLTPWITQARLAVESRLDVQLEELTHGLANVVLATLDGRAMRPRRATASDERRVSTVIRFIDAHLKADLALGRLAGFARMSPFHFLRVFRQVAGLTPHQYILRARLREAALRLRTRSDAVTDVALDTGFQDLSNFNRAFRTEFGMAPSAFRRSTMACWRGR